MTEIFLLRLKIWLVAPPYVDICPTLSSLSSPSRDQQTVPHLLNTCTQQNNPSRVSSFLNFVNLPLHQTVLRAFRRDQYVRSMSHFFLDPLLLPFKNPFICVTACSTIYSLSLPLNLHLSSVGALAPGPVSTPLTLSSTQETNTILFISQTF